MAPTINNPQWRELQTLIDQQRLGFDKQTNTFRPIPGNQGPFNYVLAKYVRTIADPMLVSHVAQAIGQANFVEVDAGQGYWSYLLSQHGKQGKAYDKGTLLRGPRSAWPGVELQRQDNHRRCLTSHDRDVLVVLNTTHPYQEILIALKQFNGRRIVVALQDAPDYPRLADVLANEWVEVDRFKGACRAMEPRTVFTFDRKGWANAPTTTLPTLRMA